MPLAPGSVVNVRIVAADEVDLIAGEGSTFDLPRKEVSVSPDGSVFWSRPGLVRTLCPMRGLQNFPYDELACVLKFGGWAISGELQNISLYEPAWSSELAPNFTFQVAPPCEGGGRREVAAGVGGARSPFFALRRT